jgi:hypothetical protein
MTTLGSPNLEQLDLKVKEAFVAGVRGYDACYQDIFIIETPQRKNERFTIVKTDSSIQEVADGGEFPSKSTNEIGANEISQKVFKSSNSIGDFADAFDNYGSKTKSNVAKAN